MLPDAAILDASKTIIDVGVIGAALILTICALIWTMRQWLAALKRIDALRLEQLTDAKSQAALGVEMKHSMEDSIAALQANTSAVQTLIQVSQNRGRA